MTQFDNCVETFFFAKRSHNVIIAERVRVMFTHPKQANCHLRWIRLHSRSHSDWADPSCRDSARCQVDSWWGECESPPTRDARQSHGGELNRWYWNLLLTSCYFELKVLTVSQLLVITRCSDVSVMGESAWVWCASCEIPRIFHSFICTTSSLLIYL